MVFQALQHTNELECTLEILRDKILYYKQRVLSCGIKLPN